MRVSTNFRYTSQHQIIWWLLFVLRMEGQVSAHLAKGLELLNLVLMIFSNKIIFIFAFRMEGQVELNVKGDTTIIMTSKLFCLGNILPFWFLPVHISSHTWILDFLDFFRQNFKNYPKNQVLLVLKKLVIIENIQKISISLLYLYLS